MDNKLKYVLCDTLTCLQDSFMMFFLLLESWRAEEERSSWPTGSRDMKPWFGNILVFFLSSSPSFFCHFLLPPVLSSFIYYHLIPVLNVFPSICKTSPSLAPKPKPGANLFGGGRGGVLLWIQGEAKLKYKSGQ